MARRLVVVAVVAIATIAHAGDVPRALAVVDKDSGPTRAALTGLTRAGVVVERIAPDAPDLAARLAARGGAIALALGPRAARRLAGVDGPRAALLVRAGEAPAGMAAVVLEAPLAEALPRLTRTFPGRTRLVVVGRPVDGGALAQAARDAGVSLELLAVRRPGDAVVALERALATDRRRTIVWVAPDPEVVTGDVVAPLARAALAARVPLIGFSRTFFGAGALGVLSIEHATAAVRADAMARAHLTAHEAPPATLVVAGRLAERLGVAIKPGAGVVVER